MVTAPHSSLDPFPLMVCRSRVEKEPSDFANPPPKTPLPDETISSEENQNNLRKCLTCRDTEPHLKMAMCDSFASLDAISEASSP